MNIKAAFASLVPLPVVIDGPGSYATRSGAVVTVAATSQLNDFGCRGAYANGTPECWHRSGRLYFGTLSANDIVARL